MTAREKLVAALIARGGAGTVFEAGRSEEWASATFSGARHELALRVPAAGVAGFLDGLEEAEFALRGHLVADIAVAGLARDGDWVSVRVEALTVVEE